VAAVFLCDVMGHGLRAALITAVLRGLVEELKPHAADPGGFLAAMNHSLHSILRRTDETILATAFMLTADLATQEVCFANAGHPSPFHLRRRASSVVELREHDPTHGPALGLFADSKFPLARFSVETGDAIVLFTDGLHEAQNDAGEEFGLARVKEFVRHRLGAATSSILSGLVAEAGVFARGRPFEDDVCFIAADFAGAALNSKHPFVQ